MAWSDILGAIGSAAGGIGGLVGGSAGSILGGIGSLANLGGSVLATNTASQQAQQAQQATGQATGAALSLAQQQAREEGQSFSKAMGLIPQETEAYKTALAALGPAPATPTFDVGDVETRASQLMPQYMQEADYTMQDMFGKDMGALMRAGIDDSTYGIQSRAALGAKSADVHRAAYNQAYTDALNYVTGIADITGKTHTQAMSDRAAALKEAMDPYSTAFGDYAGLYGHTGSAASALNVAGNLADQSSKAAAVGAAGAQTGAAASSAKSSLSDMWAGLKDIFGNTNSANNRPTTIDPTTLNTGLGAGTGLGIGN